MFYDCPKLGGKPCDNLIINGVLVRNLCPNTCQTCPQGGKEVLYSNFILKVLIFIKKIKLLKLSDAMETPHVKMEVFVIIFNHLIRKVCFILSAFVQWDLAASFVNKVTFRLIKFNSK